MTRVPSTHFDLLRFLPLATKGVSAETFQKDQFVFQQDDNCNAVYYLQEGQAKVTVVSEQGKEAVLKLLAPGDFFGEACLKGHRKHLSTVRALTRIIVTRVDRHTMSQTIHEQPDFADLFIAHLLTRNSRAEDDLVDQLFNSSEKRLARTLLLLANFGKGDEAEPVLATISQATLAEMIGTTRSRVNYFMNMFRKLGLISYNRGHIEVHRALLNVVLHDRPEIRPWMNDVACASVRRKK